MVWGSTKPESIATNASLSECNTVNKFQAFDIGSAYSHPLGVLIAKCLHLQESLDNTVVGGFLSGTEIGGEQLKISPGIYRPTA